MTFSDEYSSASANFTDYGYSSGGTLLFAPGETLKVLRYNLTSDTAAEPAESFHVRLTAPINAVISDTWATVTIAANDGAGGIPTVSVRGTTVDEKSGMAAFVLMLDRPSTELVSLDFATQDGLATAGSDYSARSGRVAFAPGETTRTVFVPIIDDATGERDELFNLLLSNPGGVNIAQASASARIVANDGANVATPTISVDNVVGDERRGYVDVVVRLSAPSTQQVSVTYTDVYIGNDYFDYTYSQSGTLTFAPGETLKLLRYVLVDDSASEPAESFSVLLSAPTNAVMGNSRALVTIAANDGSSGVPHLSLSPVTVDERGGVAIFTFLLDKPSTDLVSVDFATSPLSAFDETDVLERFDYYSQFGTVVFQPGEMVQTVSVVIRDDSTAESDEFFKLNLSGPVGTTLAQTSATARIVANDGVLAATPLIFVESAVANESDGFVDFVFRLSAPSAQQVTVVYADEYQGTVYFDYGYSRGGTLIFAPGETTKSARFALIGDSEAERAESFVVHLTSPVNGLIGTPYATATIASHAVISGTPFVRVDSALADESGAIAFVVSLSEPATDNVRVQYTTANGTALSGTDYVATSGTVGFAPGQTTQTIWVPLVNDSLAEPEELFSLILSNPVGAGLAQASAIARIGASDATAVATPVITVESVVGNESTGYVDVVFKLSAPSAQQVSFNYTDEYNSAWASTSDYVYSNSGILVFAPGEII